MLKSLYFFLFIIGSAIPYSQFIPFLWEHGLDLSLFFSQLFANPISRFFAFDLLISAIALWVWVYAEGRRLSMSRLWLYPLITLSIGVSAALPIFPVDEGMALRKEPQSYSPPSHRFRKS
jgi:hypothetical protein